MWEKEQFLIKERIIEKDDFHWNLENLRYVAGVDVSFSGKFKDGACAGLIIWDFQKAKIVY